MQSRIGGGGGGHWEGSSGGGDSPPSDYHNESNARDTPYNICAGIGIIGGSNAK